MIDGGGTPLSAQSLTVRGRADVRIVAGLVPEYLAATRRSMDARTAEEFERNSRAMYERTARIAIVPVRARVHDFGVQRPIDNR